MSLETHRVKELLEPPRIRVTPEGPSHSCRSYHLSCFGMCAEELRLLQELVGIAPHKDFLVGFEHLRKLFGVVREVESAAHGCFELSKMQMLQNWLAWIVPVEHLEEPEGDTALTVEADHVIITHRQMEVARISGHEHA